MKNIKKIASATKRCHPDGMGIVIGVYLEDNTITEMASRQSYIGGNCPMVYFDRPQTMAQIKEAIFSAKE